MKRIVILAIVLFLVVNVSAQTIDLRKNSDKFLLEGVEKYLNNICFFDRLFLNIVIEKIDPAGNSYVRLEKDVPVKLIINSDIYCGAIYYVDYSDPTDLEDATIYITSGFFLILENETELIASIAHELGHLSSLDDRAYLDITKEEYLKSEMAADKIGILVAKEIGYKPEALVELYRRILIHRLPAVKKIVKEIYEAEPENKNKYKEYLYFTETQFKVMKKIVEYLQQKSGK